MKERKIAIMIKNQPSLKGGGSFPEMTHSNVNFRENFNCDFSFGVGVGGGFLWLEREKG